VNKKFGITLKIGRDDLHIRSGGERFRCAGFGSSLTDDAAMLESFAARCCKGEPNQVEPELRPDSAPDAAVSPIRRPAEAEVRSARRRRPSLGGETFALGGLEPRG